MQMTAIPGPVLTGQGGGGSWSVGVPNPAPSIGPTSGTEATLGTTVDTGLVAAAVTMPDQYMPTGPIHEPDSQYSVPVQKG